MSQYLSPQQGIKELVSKLELQLNTLANQMRTQPDRLRVDAAWLVPYREQATVDSTKGIEVTPLEGSEAVDRIVAGLTAIRIEAGRQNPRETLRAPGVVALPTEWINRLIDLNDIKAQIQILVESIPDQYERMKVWRSMPYLSGLQTMRKAWIVPAPAKIRFYWDSAPSVKPSSASKLIAEYSTLLKKLYGHVPVVGELDDGDRNIKYVYGIEALAGLPPTERIAVFRPGKPHIRSRVTFIDTIAPEIRPCPAPIVYDIEEPVPLITPLLDWEPTPQTKQRSSRAKIEAEPFVESLYLHRYMPPHRFGADKV